MQGKIKIVLNGKDYHLGGGCSLLTLLLQLGLNQEHVAVELNGEIVSRQQWESRQVKENDAIEVVHFVGGGEQVND